MEGAKKKPPKTLKNKNTECEKKERRSKKKKKEQKQEHEWSKHNMKSNKTDGATRLQ